MPVLSHPAYGTAETLELMFTNDRGQTYVAAYWGAWRIFAVVPATEVTILR